MGIDFLTGEITAEQHQLTDFEVRETVGAMQHGQEAYTDESFFWIDRERKMWVQDDAPIYNAEEVAVCVKEDGMMPVRCIRIDRGDINGWIIDCSSWDGDREFGDVPKMHPQTGEGYDNQVARHPVIGFVSSKAGLDRLEEILASQFQLKLGTCAISAALRPTDENEK